MSDRNLKDDLEASTKVRKAHGSRLAKIRVLIMDVKKKLRMTKEFKDLKNLKNDLKLAEQDYSRACETIFGIVDEIQTGQTRLPLFDAAQSQRAEEGRRKTEEGRGKTEESTNPPSALSLPSSALPRRGPGRPRKQEQEAAQP